MIETLFRTALGLLSAVVLQTSCTSGIDVTDDGVNVDVGVDTGGGSGDVPSDSIRVRFANRTPHALDVEFHASDSLGTNISAALFSPGNQITEGIGFAGTGLIDTGGSDFLMLACEDVAVLGTEGGRFVDPDDGELIGNGQQRVAVRGLQYDCGETITFIFDDVGSEFETSMVIN
jgi:hypothetical protein